MTCPVCGGNSRVVNTRKDVDAVYRQRKCYECHYIFYTAEYETEEAHERINEIHNNYQQEKKRRRKGN